MKEFELESVGVQEMNAVEIKHFSGGDSWAEVLSFITYILANAKEVNWRFVNVRGDFRDVDGSYANF